MNIKHFIAGSSILLVLLFASCAGSPYAEVGSLDHSKVELLSDGRAKIVDILTINDFHATLADDPLGKNAGIGKMTTVLNTLKAINPNTVLVSAGDNYQGSALSIVTRGKIVSEFFKLVNMNASAVGNHEFDWTDEHFDTWTKEGGFPFLAANIVDKRTNALPSWAKPYTIIMAGGHKIAFIGLTTTETPNSTKAENVANYSFENAAVSAKRWVNYLKVTEKPEVIILITHIPSIMDKIDTKRVIPPSLANDELSGLASIEGVDAIVTGHSHQSVLGTTFRVPVIQAYYNGRSFGKISIAFKDSGKPKITASINEFYKTKTEISDNPEAMAILAKYNAIYGKEFLAPVATLNADLTHDPLVNVTPMGNYICELMKQRYKVDVAVMNGGGLRKGFLTTRKLVVQDFWDLLPFDNTAVTFEVSGKDLKDIIDHGIDSQGFGNGQFAGLFVKYNPNRPYGSKIISMTLSNGKEVKDNEMYTVVTNDFVFDGGDAYTMIKGAAKNVNQTYEVIRDAIIADAKKDGSISVPDVSKLLTSLSE